ncbi:MAG: DUF3267 domain-containing protein [Ardenticatenaceae bacterium]|nr:DUF3267 domain-containing protein [Ardenticatenaceae bacterium]
MKATRDLSSSYELLQIVDLTGPKLTIGLNLAGLALLFVCGWVSMKLAAEINPHYLMLPLRLFARSFSWFTFLLVLLTTVIAHELAHAFFFWFFTKERPQIGFGLLYAYAAAPTWHFPRNQFLLIGLAPLIFLSGIGLSLLPFVGETAVSHLILALTLNVAGATGDMYVCGRLLTYPAHVLARDEGAVISIYGPALDNGQQTQPPQTDHQGFNTAGK